MRSITGKRSPRVTWIARMWPALTFPMILVGCGSAQQTTPGGAFSIAADMASARASHTATLLIDGRVLIAGGCADRATPLAAAELFDPTSGVFTTTASMTVARCEATATRLTDGRVLVIGGSDPSFGLASTDLYDAKTGLFSSSGTMSTPRVSASATLLRDGRVLVVGGMPDFVSGHALASAEIYDPTTGAFTPTGPLRYARYEHTAAALPDGRVLIAGGQGDSGFTNVAEVYDPETGAFSLPDGRVLLAGGVVAPMTAQSAAQLYDPATGTFSATGSMAVGRRDHTATLLNDGEVLIAGGLGNAADGNYTPVASAELFDPKTGTFRATGSLGLARSRQTATLLPDGRVLIAGGNVPASASTELFKP